MNDTSPGGVSYFPKDEAPKPKARQLKVMLQTGDGWVQIGTLEMPDWYPLKRDQNEDHIVRGYN